MARAFMVLTAFAASSYGLAVAQEPQQGQGNVIQGLEETRVERIRDEFLAMRDDLGDVYFALLVTKFGMTEAAAASMGAMPENGQMAFATTINGQCQR